MTLHDKPDTRTSLPRSRPSATGGFSSITNEPQFGPFKLTRRIAISGLGELYQAQNTSTIQTGILKRLRGDRAGSALARQRFELEIGLGHELKHPNLVNVLETGKFDDRLYLFLEEVRGPSFRQVLQSQSPWQMTPQMTLLALEQVARAVAVVHRAGVAHCDLKPENVLMRGPIDPVVIDFGLAVRLRNRLPVEEPEQQAVTGYILGTPGYMPPETITGKMANATPAADVYSFGIMLYETLAGRPPFVQEESGSRQGALMKLIEAVVAEKPPAIRSFKPDIAEAWEGLCQSCLQKNPLRRPQSLEAVARDVGAIIRTGKAMPVTETGLMRRMTGWLRKPGS